MKIIIDHQIHVPLGLVMQNITPIQIEAEAIVLLATVRIMNRLILLEAVALEMLEALAAVILAEVLEALAAVMLAEALVVVILAEALVVVILVVVTGNASIFFIMIRYIMKL